VQTTSYDEVPYRSYPFPQSHPDRLAAVGTLLGLDPPPVDRCRVLEVGCASGGNLIPMAEGLPTSTFVGIDLSERQIAQGRECVEALGLRNVELRHLDLAAAGPELGTFDYVVCHGVFSWVSHAAQEKILGLCGRLLCPTGLAYVSYNTLPGWRMRGAVRDMMLYHVKRFAAPDERADQALALLDFMAAGAAAEGSPFGNFLRSELELLRHKEPWYLLHDHLEEHNEPVYFHEFVERAAAHGLRYVGEADVPSMVPSHFPPAVSGVLDRLSADQVQLEQYMDFLRNRMFRQTILCRADQQPSYQRAAERLPLLHVSSPVRPASGAVNLARGAEEAFLGPGGLRITSSEPVVKAALAVLAEAWPHSLPFPRLLALAAERARPGPVRDSAEARQQGEVLARTLWRFYATASTHALYLTSGPFRGAGRVGERPVARHLARWQAARQDHATNLLHEPTPLGEGQRRLLACLDGRHDWAALLRVMEESLGRGELTIHEGGEPVADPQRARELLGQALADALSDFARGAFLVA
jgi:methyltransferase-like protein/SAM-dependent methyltransferase